MANVVVVGAQWGDEGKGKIVDWLSARADVIVRFQGGHNAGHTLVVEDTTYKLHALPSGVVRGGKLSVIGNGVVLDPWHLVGEIETVRAQGVDISPDCLMIAENTPLILPYHELTHEGWDQHNSLKARLTSNTQATDRPIAALMSDLKDRDMLKDTLIVWSGEFGRTPAVRREDGRDHNATGFTVWMAGGGVKGGMRYGSTDDFGIAATEDKMHVHDLHATILHLLGMDHTKLTYRYAGRDFRLTDVYGRVPKEIVA